MTTNDNDQLSAAGQSWLDRPTTDMGPATPAPEWCLPGTEPEWEQLTEQYGGGQERPRMRVVSLLPEQR
ncbi:hypothetical protein MML61_22530 [Mycobacterium marinum]|uniref:hypothetical protein n=1 Tax=Mycobacterium marinum TaxID=1781 RepID=UPI000EC8C110|nr:hypothetical protein [Mycobacterium marinum]RFZ09541.1 hypothetical protein VIMS_03712 [Mycobacterium marinum]RFZ42837.1 hypothetical protein KST_01365 [Mycobacterium marinum]WCS17543.1 hypothetical protein MML61_22530 [Mycobacterium marinum]GJN97834.1 hypothetical protein NJB1907f34b_08040 [Mycobacterium marinum]GJO08394.1 hypothetical protein NJB1907E90_23060 [Mycobacterium marinum]